MPSASGNPNLESGTPVWRYSWVWAVIPGLNSVPAPAEPEIRCQRSDQGDPSSIERIDHDSPDSRLRAHGDFSIGLVVPVHDDLLCRDTGRERHVQLSTRRHVDVHTGLEGNSCHRGAEKGFGGIGNTFTKGLHSLAASIDELLLVVDEQRRPELSHQIHHPATTNGQMTADHSGRFGQKPTRYGSTDHIRSGISIPNRSRSRSRTLSVTSTSASHEPCRCGSVSLRI